MTKKLAIPVINGFVNDHFGHSKEFHIYTLDDGNNIINKEVFLNEQGCGCKSNLAGELKTKGVKTLLAGNMGNGAKQKLESEGIDVLTGLSGLPENVINNWLAGKVSYHFEPCKTNHNCSH